MDLLPFWMQYTAALLIFFGLISGAVYFGWWGVQRVRKFFDGRQSTFDE